MKKLLLLFLVTLFTLSNSYAQCEYSLLMADTYGDGWNGNTIDVLVDGLVVLDDVTLDNGYDGSIPIPVVDGQEITTVWNAGGEYGYETSYTITDNIGTSVGSESEADISTAIVVACQAIPDPPSNISCATADTITCGETISTNSLGSTATSEGIGCLMGENGVWYTFLGTGFEMTLTVDASFDHRIGLAEGECGSEQVNIACVDSSIATETYTFESTQDMVYYVYIAHYSSAGTSTGDIDITLDCATCVIPTATYTIVDDCETSGGFLIDVDITDLGSATSLDVFDGTTTIEITDTGVEQFGPYALETEVNFTITNNQDTTCEILSPTLTKIACSPTNDDCSNAKSFLSLPFSDTLDASGATNNAGFIAECGFGMNDGVWYTFTPISDGVVDIVVENVDGWDPEVAVYTGSCGTFTCVDSVDDGGADVSETISGMDVTNGVQYWINIGYYGGSTDSQEGLFTLNVSGTGLSVEDNIIEGFSIYPNPVNDVLRFAAQDNIDEISVYNLLGQEVLRTQPKVLNTQVDMTKLPTGMYVVKVKVGQQLGSYRVVKE
ncbi:T9SS type A sorting domain-containing protein [Urechidicola croceus]|uniref:Secretion system C-terminal sorting domain-containing protein n=1 Tax=Urechidicola croceus TaxID=1850246 RepID=A0A1D8P3P8_9FLAO|nr:T9SS type A sorting domain-containing protein [Urechidicola croceus]AOW19193.1 hypothetical protein LPB138_00160 [Urechidicola croceus]